MERKRTYCKKWPAFELKIRLKIYTIYSRKLCETKFNLNYLNRRKPKKHFLIDFLIYSRRNREKILFKCIKTLRFVVTGTKMCFPLSSSTFGFGEKKGVWDDWRLSTPPPPPPRSSAYRPPAFPVPLRALCCARRVFQPAVLFTHYNSRRRTQHTAHSGIQGIHRQSNLFPHLLQSP